MTILQNRMFWIAVAIVGAALIWNLHVTHVF
jgi:hypothetical protein